MCKAWTKIVLHLKVEGAWAGGPALQAVHGYCTSSKLMQQVGHDMWGAGSEGIPFPSRHEQGQTDRGLPGGCH